jgi:chromosome partitioning protein
MKTIAVVSQKGGAGKTTIAVNLSGMAIKKGLQCAVIDLDPQASAKVWHDIRKQTSPVVISAQSSRLPEILEKADRSGADLVILDTAPHSETAALAAARVSDLVIIPCRPSVLDLKAIVTSIDLAAIAKKDSVVVLNGVPSRGILATEASAVIASYGVDLAPVMLGYRAAYVHSLTIGMSAVEYEETSKASEEIMELYLWITMKLGINSNVSEVGS